MAMTGALSLLKFVSMISLPLVYFINGETVFGRRVAR